MFLSQKANINSILIQNNDIKTINLCFDECSLHSVYWGVNRNTQAKPKIVVHRSPKPGNSNRKTKVNETVKIPALQQVFITPPSQLRK